jgi:membrane associated rhomboid family serine protease
MSHGKGITMLIIPLTGKLSKHNPPLITMGIILINCFVFFVLQSGDSKRYLQAMEFYFNSGLAKIEVSEYMAYLETTGKGEIDPAVLNKKDLDKHTVQRLYKKMQEDEVFLKELRTGTIITPEDETYDTWKNLRTQFDDLLSKLVSMRYGFRPASRNYLTALTYMFIHGGFMHLLGNMVFLWLVGCVLELGLGRVLYVSLYLLTGVLSVCIYALAYLDSTVPLVGASGAISGLIGAYAVTYGKQKIKVFYSLGFYFNYAQVSAIALLPVWIGNEVVQLFFGSYRHVAYMAHIGGLTSGAVLGYLNMRFLGQVDRKIFEQDPRQRISGLLEEALQRIARLEMNAARPLLEQVLEIDSSNREAITHLFNIEKLSPQDKAFHETASRLLRHLSHDPNAHETLYKTYKEYCRVSKPPRLSLDLLCLVASVFTVHGHLSEAESILAVLLRNRPGLQEIPTGILNLARAYLKGGISDKGKRCLKIICQKYPGSAESQIARRLLQESS